MTDFYSTTDMQLATVLSMKFPLRELKIEGKRGTFIFDASLELEDFVKSFWDKQLSVEPLALFNALKTIKNRLYVETKQ